MKIIAHEIYHMYNRGNNKQKTFLLDQDYIQFLKLIRKFVYPHCKIFCYCLMPNHFHFLIYATEKSAQTKKLGNIDVCELTNGFRLVQSLYCSYFNTKYQKTGSLFTQKLNIKSLSHGDYNYAYIAFQYIHQNPLKAGLVKKMEKWHYSSFSDYMKSRKGTLCDQVLAEQFIAFDSENFERESYNSINEDLLQNIFRK